MGDDVRKENKLLSNEIKDIMDQITEGGRSIHEIDKIRKRLEAEKMELQSALEEAEATLEQEENKVLRCQMELNQVKTEIERRIAEKDEEFAMVRKNQAKALDSMQSALETEAKGKAEALRMKKKLESDAADLGLALEHSIAGNAETQTTIKKYQLQVRDAQAKSAAADAKVAADRKAAAMQNCLEESRALLETADRQRRAAEQELADTNENLADLSNVNQSIAAARRKLESEFNQLQSDLDEMSNEARLLKRRLPEPWLMLLVLLMSSDVSRSSPWLLRRTRSFLRPSARTPVPVLMRPRSMPSREAERP